LRTRSRAAQVGAGERRDGESGEHGLVEGAVVALGDGRAGIMFGRGDDIQTDVLVACELESERFGAGAPRCSTDKSSCPR
jgi:hypothetical protein